MGEVGPPAPRLCASCPYRVDVPSGIWEDGEYAKLSGFDGDMARQRPSVFLCHQVFPGDDGAGRMCAGWVACHGGESLLGLRVAVVTDQISVETFNAACGYVSPVEVFASGAEAAAHGRRDIISPGPAARDAMAKIARVRGDTLAPGPSGTGEEPVPVTGPGQG